MRGSTPAPGEAFVRYGGHTSCVAMQALDADQPDLVLDAGTGIRDLGDLLGAPFDGTLVLSHLHGDHTHGLPFSAAVLDPQARLRVLVPAAPGESPLDALLPGFSPPTFPVPIDELAPGWTFASADADQEAGAWRIRTAPIRHKGGRTIGIRVEREGRSLVYMPDHDLAEPDPDAARLAAGADVLLHDAQYLRREIEDFRHYGHSTIDRAIGFAESAGVRHLVLTHHAPARTDDELDAIATSFATDGPGMRISVARQGGVVEV